MFPSTVPYQQPGLSWNTQGAAPLPSDPTGLFRTHEANPLNNMDAWVGSVASFANNGLAPLQDYNKPEFDSNVAITYSRPMAPWLDKTHLQIQKQMVVMLNKNGDPKYPIYTACPVYKLNIMMEDAYNEYTNQFNGADADTDFFKQYLDTYGEESLCTFDRMRKSGMAQNNRTELAKFSRLAHTDEFRYLTKHGITSCWSFDGVAVSKGETEEPNAYLDHIESADIVPMVGVIVGGRARVQNIWGHVRPGHKLYLVLTRVKKANGKYGTFKIVPYCGMKKPEHYYLDDSGRECKAHVWYVGTADDVRQKDPSQYNIDKALGVYRIAEGAFSAYGSLPSFDVYIGI